MILCNENAISSGNYIISNSLRFQSASTTYATRTPSVASNRQTWTWSGWVKRGVLGTANQRIFEVNTPTVNNQTCIRFDTADTMSVFSVDSGTVVANLTTTQVFRDPSAWYHVVAIFDTTNATASNRVKLYINGVQVTAFSSTTYPAQNYLSWFNYTNAHYFGTAGAVSIGVENFDGYLAEVNFIDGQALTPSSFGMTDPTSGQWVAKKYTGTYGTNGFYLPFSNGTSTTTLGADSSGNGNNWTLTNFTRSAGVSDCWMVDVPSGNGGASGTQPNSNYAVLNPLDQTNSVLSNANLKLTVSASKAGAVSSFEIPQTGKWYWEFIYNAGTERFFGVLNSSHVAANLSTVTATQWVIYGTNATPASFINKDGTNVQTGLTQINATNVIGIAFDSDSNTIQFYNNNVAVGTAVTLTSARYMAWISSGNNTATNLSVDANFGQRSFAYTPPSGYKALCTANLPVATIKQGNKYMDATLATGNNSTQVITNAAGFKPDMVWMKIRSAVENHILYDSVRGATNYLVPNLTAAEGALATGLTSFNSNGFTLGNANPNYAGSPTFVAWQWQAGQGSTSSNTNGTITSTVSVNATAGFSIVTWTSQASGTATVGHGLGVAPKMIITKIRNTANAWLTYHASLGATNYVSLNTTNASASSATVWNSTSPTSSVMSFGTDWAASYSMVAYCFAEIAGYSKFGSYTGNGSADGPFVYLGFRPKYVMIKNTTTASTNWLTWDSTTNSYNVANLYLIPNSSVAEQTTGADIDVLSNGFKVRNTSGAGNTSGATIIFAAFAENPFQNSNAR